MRRLLVAITTTATLTIAAPAGADPVPNALTPVGPATVSSVWRGPVTQEGLAPEVLTAVRITVGPGGQGGPIRLRVSSPLDPAMGVELGPWSDLPATPGEYTFALPAPIFWDYRSGIVAIDQQAGGHAIVTADPCRAELGAGDVCRLVSLDVFHDIADGDPAIGTATTPAERYPGQQLAIADVTSQDLDRDHIPDDRDRTDLVLSATRAYNVSGAQVMRIVLRNDGPLTADQPLVGVGTTVGGPDDWFPSCTTFESFEFPGIRLPDGAVPGASCGLAPIRPRVARIVTLKLPQSTDTRAITVVARGEGADLAAADNTVRVAPAALIVLGRVSLRHRAVVGVRAHRRGLLRVSVRIGPRISRRTVRVVGPGVQTVAVDLPRHTRLWHSATVSVTMRAFDGATGRDSRRVL